MEDDGDPVNGWSVNEYSEFAAVAKDDAYGALYFYLLNILLSFYKRVHSFDISFEVFSLDAVGLASKLTTKFDRIEVCLYSFLTRRTEFPISQNKRYPTSPHAAGSMRAARYLASLLF
jgi:hypothetical protein